MFWKHRTRVPSEYLKNGHLYWVKDDTCIDLGPVTEEDLRLQAYVVQEANKYLVSRKNTASGRTLSRVNALAQRLYQLARQAR